MEKSLSNVISAKRSSPRKALWTNISQFTHKMIDSKGINTYLEKKCPLFAQYYSSQKIVGPPCWRGPLLLQRELFFCRHSLPSSSSIVHLKNCSLCVHKHKILNYHHHQRVIQFSWKIKFVMGPLIQQSTGYEKQPHININGVLKIALKASFWLLYLFGAAMHSWILK